MEVTDTVVLGSAVTVKFSGGRTETYYVLGLLDTVPKRNMISFETPLGKLLIGRKLDERLEMPSGEHGQIIEITTVAGTTIPENEVVPEPVVEALPAPAQPVPPTPVPVPMPAPAPAPEGVPAPPPVDNTFDQGGAGDDLPF